MKNMRFESLDVTNDLPNSFERLEDWTAFYIQVQEKWEELEKKDYRNIHFEIYGDCHIEYTFTYERILSEEEISKENAEKLKKEEQDKVFSELCGKLSTNSIGAIIQNDDLKALYLNGQIKI